MKRASSPPEATCSIGPGAAPGLVVTTKPTWSQPKSPQRASSSLSSCTVKRAFSSFSGGSSSRTAASRNLMARLRRLAQRFGRRHVGRARLLLGLAQLGDAAALVLQRGELLLQALVELGQGVRRDAMLAREVAQQIQPLLQLLQPLRIGIERRDQPAERGQAFRQLDGGAVERGDRRFAFRAQLVGHALQPALRRRQGALRRRGRRRGRRARRSALPSPARGWRAARARPPARPPRRPWARRDPARRRNGADSPLRCAPCRSSPRRRHAPAWPCARRRRRRGSWRPAARAPRSGRDASRWVPGSSKPCASNWPSISTSRSPSWRSSAMLIGWSLTKARRAAVVADLAAQDQVAVAPAGPARPAGHRPGGPPAGRTPPSPPRGSRPRAPAPTSERAPSARPSASSRIDLPAPVSPVSTVSPIQRSEISCSIRTTLRMASAVSMKLRARRQKAPCSQDPSAGSCGWRSRDASRL